MQVSEMHSQMCSHSHPTKRAIKYRSKRSDLKPSRETDFEHQKRFDVPIRSQIVD